MQSMRTDYNPSPVKTRELHHFDSLKLPTLAAQTHRRISKTHLPLDTPSRSAIRDSTCSTLKPRFKPTSQMLIIYFNRKN